MSAQLVELLGSYKTFLPWVSLVAGLGGSLHCVGMCGGLVTASCEKSPDVVRYQVGRLLGYLLLGGLAGSVGLLINFSRMPASVAMLPSLVIGALFIHWGIQNFRGQKAEVPTPPFLRKLYTQLWQKLVRTSSPFTKAFFTGFISILLPCGLLYGVVLGTVALESTALALTSMFCFWLGTVPSMVFAPKVIRQVIAPFRSKLPRTYAIGLMTIGLMTITFRVVKFYGEAQPITSDLEVHSCHR